MGNTPAPLATTAAGIDLLTGLAGQQSPNQPAPQVPLDPNPSAGNPPDINAPSPNASAPDGSFGQKLGAALTASKNDGTAGALLTQPSGFAKMFLSATLSALAKPAQALRSPGAAQTSQGIQNGWAHIAGDLSDLSSAVSPLDAAGHRNGGALGGAANVAAAQTARQNAEQKTQFDQSQEGQKLELEKQRTGAQVALSNSQQLHTEALTHQLGDEALDKGIASGKAALDVLSKAPSPATAEAKGIDSDEIHQMLVDGRFNPSTQTAYLTGKKVIPGVEDANGNPRYRGTYDIVTLPAAVNVTNQQQADELLGPGKVSVSEDRPFVIPGAQYNALVQQANDRKMATEAAQKAADEVAIATGQRAEKVEAMNFAGSNVWNNALSAQLRKTPDDISGATLRAYATLAANPPLGPDGKPLYPNITGDIREKIGPKLWDGMVEQAQKAADKRAEEAVKIRGKKAETSAQAEKQRNDDIRNLEKAIDENQKTVSKRVKEIYDEGRQPSPDEAKQIAEAQEEIRQAREKRNGLLGLHPADSDRTAQLKKIGDSIPVATRAATIANSPSLTAPEKAYLFKLYGLTPPQAQQPAQNQQVNR